MTGMLASVNSLEEATLIKTLNVDIIDLKQPSEGALGALNTEVVRQIIAAVNGDKPVSATVGDLPMQPDLVFQAAREMAETGVDFIKIGFFPGDNWPGTIEKLSSLTADYDLIAVLFADTQPDITVIPVLQQAGFKGVMLDTMDKNKGSLTTLMTFDDIKQFVSVAKQHALLTGLAGSLKATDIADLLPLNTDYLGFRGALCEQYDRVARLDQEKIISIIQCFLSPAIISSSHHKQAQAAD